MAIVMVVWVCSDVTLMLFEGVPRKLSYGQVCDKVSSAGNVEPVCLAAAPTGGSPGGS